MLLLFSSAIASPSSNNNKYSDIEGVLDGVTETLGVTDIVGVSDILGVVDIVGVTLTEGVTDMLGVTETEGVILGVTDMLGVTDTEGVGETSKPNAASGAVPSPLLPLIVDFNIRSCPLPDILF